MTIQSPTYVSPGVPATVLRYDGKTLHILTNNPNSTVDFNGNVVLNVTKISIAKSAEANAAAPALTNSQGGDTQNAAENHDSAPAVIDVKA